MSKIFFGGWVQLRCIDMAPILGAAAFAVVNAPNRGTHCDLYWIGTVEFTN